MATLLLSHGLLHRILLALSLEKEGVNPALVVVPS